MSFICNPLITVGGGGGGGETLAQTLILGDVTGASSGIYFSDGDGANFASSSEIAFSSTTNPFGVKDAFIIRSAANTLAVSTDGSVADGALDLGKVLFTAEGGTSAACAIQFEGFAGTGIHGTASAVQFATAGVTRFRAISAGLEVISGGVKLPATSLIYWNSDTYINRGASAGIVEISTDGSSADGTLNLNVLNSTSLVSVATAGDLSFGDDGEVSFSWSSAQAIAKNLLVSIDADGTALGGGAFILTSKANNASDHGRPVSSEVTLAIYDANTNPSVDGTKHIDIWHDGAFGNISSPVGLRFIHSATNVAWTTATSLTFGAGVDLIMGVGGVINVGEIDSSAWINVGTTTDAVATGDAALSDGTRDFFYDSSENVLAIREDSSHAVSTAGQMFLANNGTRRQLILRTANATGSTGPIINFNKARGTLAAEAQVQDGDVIGHFGFSGYLAGAGNLYRAMADIVAYVDGAPTYAVTEQGRLSFQTRTGTSSAERWTIRHDGHLEPGADSAYNIGTTSLRVLKGWFDSIEVGGDVTVGNNLVGAAGNIQGWSRDVTARAEVAASPYALLDADGWRVITNEGATAEVHIDLPTAGAGFTYTFIVQDTDGIQINAAAGDTIRIAGTVSASGGFVSSTTIGDVIILICINATEWIATTPVMGWTFDT